jgi:pimeloyl-ACP methyl ester carboxylesterase
MDGGLRFTSGPDGYRIAYRVGGQGPPLVLLPGLGMDSRGWQDFGYVELLAPRHRLLMVDPLGHGSSDRPDHSEAYGLEALADHTAAVMDAEGVEAADIWGYSRGAGLLVAMMQHQGHRVRSAVAGGIDLTALASSQQLGEATTPTPAEFLRRGDWAGFWDVFSVELSAERRARAERDNDPHAIAAALEAAAAFNITVDPTAFRGMVYVGDGEPFAQATSAIAELFELPCAVLPTGGHSQTFEASVDVCAVVVPFLETA